MENVRLLRRIFGPKRNELIGEWRTLQYCSGDQIEKNETDGHVARTGQWRGLGRVLVGKPEMGG